MDDQSHRRARELIIELAGELGMPGPGPKETSGRDAAHDALMRQRLITAQAWQRMSALRRTQFENSETLFSDPGWELLLDLYVSNAKEQRVMISGACLAANVPTTTGLRWIERLSHAGLIAKEPDPTDGRRIYVTLTRKARLSIENTLDAAIESDRKLGLARIYLV